jgi:type I restriction enzyme S subunit
MVIKKNHLPLLRFSNFQEKWRFYSLSNITSLITKGTTPKKFSDKGVHFVKIESLDGINIIKSKCLLVDKEINDNELKRSILKENDLLFAIAGATIGKLGIVSNSILPANTNQALAIIRLKESKSVFFLLQILQSRVMKKYIEMNISVGAQPNLNLQQIGDFSFYAPQLPEQQKIASFLTDVDDKITKLTKKKTLLEQYKKGVMQKIFNQELRFKDDDGNAYPDWEEKQLRDVANYRRGSFPQPYGLSKWYDKVNGIPFVQVYDVDDNMLLKPSAKHKISALGAKQSVFVEKGTLIITIQGSIGRIAKTQYDAYVDRTLLIFQSYKKPLNLDYFKYVLFLLFEIEKRKAPGGIIKTITKEVLSSFNVMIPSLEEQAKIANFLSDIDLKIEALNTKIENNKSFKKGLLQKMFV